MIQKLAWLFQMLKCIKTFYPRKKYSSLSFFPGPGLIPRHSCIFEIIIQQMQVQSLNEHAFTRNRNIISARNNNDRNIKKNIAGKPYQVTIY